MFKKGHIVLIPFPFTDLSGKKLRPAVVLHAEKKSDDVIVIFLTSQVQKHRGTFDINIKADAKNGLKVDSMLRCDKVATLDKQLILGTLGSLSQKDLKNINAKLKKIFKL